MTHTHAIPVWKEYPYTKPPELTAGATRRLKTLIVGGGPIGLAAGLDLARRDREVVILNALPFITRGSKAICFSKRTLDIWDRLGIGEQIVKKGVVWNKGKVFWKDRPEPIYEFDLLPMKHQRNPAFINIQQYYVEEFFVDALAAYDNVDIRWRNEVVSVEPIKDGLRVGVQTPDGTYDIETDYLLACDGHKSPVRNMLGLDFEGRVFEDNFLIADVRFKEERPAERWFWFEPPFPGWSSLIHKQPDGVWRLDFQLGWDVDKDEAVKPENVEPFVTGLLGPDTEFDYEWLSVYTFQCRRMKHFVHDRVLFLGDAAHLVSPFGARGCNGGYADVDNLIWKLCMVLDGRAPQSLFESYDYEATVIADENILNSSRATDFLTPKSKMSKIFRDAVLELATEYPFARAYVNSGRLSTAVSYPDSPLNTAKSDRFDGGPAPGSPCIDAPVTSTGSEWLLSHLGDRFTVLYFCNDANAVTDLRQALIKIRPTVDILQIASAGTADKGRLIDEQGLTFSRYGASDGTAYLIRPDQYVLGRWHAPDAERIKTALGNVIGES